MKCSFIHIKLKDKSHPILKNNKILEIFKLSFGNGINYLNYNKDKKVNNNLEIIYYKEYNRKNIGKMIYKNTENKKVIKIFDKIFVLNNIKAAKIIINNKQKDLEEDILNEKHNFKIKIKFLNNIFYLNSMFRDCQSLISVNNFQNINTKYLKNISDLFYGCSSLLYIDDISNWNVNNINNISAIFCKCSSLTKLPDISRWNTKKVVNMSFLFSQCSQIQFLHDISNWNTSKIEDIHEMFSGCSNLRSIPDISKWNISNVNNISGLFNKCSSLKELPDISNGIQEI